MSFAISWRFHCQLMAGVMWFRTSIKGVRSSLIGIQLFSPWHSSQALKSLFLDSPCYQHWTNINIQCRSWKRETHSQFPVTLTYAITDYKCGSLSTSRSQVKVILWCRQRTFNCLEPKLALVYPYFAFLTPLNRGLLFLNTYWRN